LPSGAANEIWQLPERVRIGNVRSIEAVDVHELGADRLGILLSISFTFSFAKTATGKRKC
jgi:hypothetical protein